METKVPIYLKHTLADLRVRAGLSQPEAAKGLGISLSLLRRWERDSSNVPIGNVEKITEFYQVPMNYIFFGRNQTLSAKISKQKIKEGA